MKTNLLFQQQLKNQLLRVLKTKKCKKQYRETAINDIIKVITGACVNIGLNQEKPYK